MNNKITVIRPRPKWQLINIREILEFSELFYIFSWRDIKVRYKQTILGILWAILQPLLSMIIFTIFFGNFAKIPSDGLPYPVFVLLGLIFWGYFSSSLSRASTVFIDNENLIKKVYFPREILLFSTVITAFIDFLISFFLFIIVALFYNIPFNFLFLSMVFLSILISALASTGLGLLVASINIKYRDVRYIIPFFLQLMIFITPVIYPLSIVRPSFQFVLSMNPMAGVINSLRSSLATNSISDKNSLFISILSSLIIFLIGMIYFRKTERYFADLI
ncbi:MAG: ABC transporter permease [Candidatus Pacebacteria bacterium]|jgi:lipopolysaccharide transport system permease protein|nr:ABC transporter permease [Candidatus Paceibacterota bacterium]MBT6756053.1 ABC transporter permease [Candidatus Paceibacterota bacterium]